MIKLTDARLTDALPKTLAEQPWVQALAEASRKMRCRVMAYADRTRLFCDIDEASEEALDALAVELQTPLYKNDYPLTVKRQIVKTVCSTTYAAAHAAPWKNCWPTFTRVQR